MLATKRREDADEDDDDDEESGVGGGGETELFDTCNEGGIAFGLCKIFWDSVGMFECKWGKDDGVKPYVN